MLKNSHSSNSGTLRRSSANRNRPGAISGAFAACRPSNLHVIFSASLLVCSLIKWQAATHCALELQQKGLATLQEQDQNCPCSQHRTQAACCDNHIDVQGIARDKGHLVLWDLEVGLPLGCNHMLNPVCAPHHQSRHRSRLHHRNAHTEQVHRPVTEL